MVIDFDISYHITNHKKLINISKHTNSITTSHTGIYSILCKDSDEHYIGETQRSLEKRIYKHKWLIEYNDDWNALFSHILALKHTSNVSKATLIKPIHCKKSCWLLESIIISISNHIPQRPGFYQTSPYLANTILHENNIKIENV